MHQVINADCLEALTQMDEGIFDLALDFLGNIW